MQEGAEEKMKLIIETTLGLAQPSTAEREPQDGVGTVLNKVAADQGIIEVQNVSLSYRGKVPDNRKKIKEYGLRDGATLHLCHRTTLLEDLPPLLFLTIHPPRTFRHS